MKLELKLLAPYLPYGIKIGRSITFYSKGNKINMFRKITLVVTNLKSILNNPKAYKLILRPLSDLTKIISTENNEGWEDDWIEHIFDFGNKLHEANILACPYDLMQELLKNHLDVFGLIEKGLAIDINTLKQ